jgi:hypothetical protein
MTAILSGNKRAEPGNRRHPDGPEFHDRIETMASDQGIPSSATPRSGEKVDQVATEDPSGFSRKASNILCLSDHTSEVFQHRQDRGDVGFHLTV